MRVRQLVGRFAGQIVEMPLAVAQACLSNGTAAMPDQDVSNIRGRRIVAAATLDHESPVAPLERADGKPVEKPRRKRRPKE